MSGPAATSIWQMIRAAFDAWMARLVAEHRALLARIARKQGLPPEEALDVVQEALVTFMRLDDARALVDDAEGSRKLLVAVTRNLARNARRRHALARPHLADEATLDALGSDAPGADELVVAAETQAQLDRCMARLGEPQRAIVTMRLFEGAAGAEVAAAIGITPGHVATLLHRARAALCACMSEAAAPSEASPGAAPDCRGCGAVARR